MAKATLPTNYQDDILNVSTEGKRKYRMVYNDDGTVSFDDVTPYDQEGSDFGAGDINATNEAVNQSLDKAKVIDDLETIQAVTNEGFVMGALAGKALNESLESFGTSILLLQTTTTTETTNTVEDITKYKYLVFVGLASDAKNSLMIPVDVFMKDTTNNYEFLSANWGAFTEYYSRFKVKYVSNTSIKTQIANKNYTGTLYIYGVK